MKRLLVLGSLLLTVNAFAKVTGDKIHFQADSTYVSAAFSKSLCFDGVNFNAKIRKCIEWSNNDERRCLAYGVFDATQPQESTRQRCAKFGGNDQDRCVEWETVRYFQSENRVVKYYSNNDDNRVIKTEEITVPACM